MSIERRLSDLEKRQQSGPKSPIVLVFSDHALTPEEIREEGTPGSVTLDLTNGTPGILYEH